MPDMPDLVTHDGFRLIHEHVIPALPNVWARYKAIQGYKAIRRRVHAWGVVEMTMYRGPQHPTDVHPAISHDKCVALKTLTYWHPLVIERGGLFLVPVSLAADGFERIEEELGS